MQEVERRTIQELVTLYQLEPELRDVYVEGVFDQALLEWFLTEAGANNFTVREIDSIQVPSDLVDQRGLEKNNRGRTIALAMVLERELGGTSACVTCVVDSDFDRILGRNRDCLLLLLTDYTSMELYFFAVPPLNKLLTLVVRRFPKSASTVLNEIRGVLKQLFAIRMANHILGWNLGIISFERCCRITRAGLEFDHVEYVTRLLNASGRHADRQQFDRVLGECGARLTGDPRHYTHGHDFLNVLAWYVRQHRAGSISREIVERSILACAEYSSLYEQAMFRQLLGRVNRAT